MRPGAETPTGVVISALGGGSGKTILAAGIIAALTQKGKTISPFKKGPDYIDAGWLSLAAGRPCRNLDTFLTSVPHALDSFRRHSSGCDASIIEGNRGLYDSIHIDGRGSTADMAKMLGLPVVLCLNCAKVTRTMAAIVMGCLHFDPDVRIAGVTLNRVAGKRHENNIRRNIEAYTGVPVIGAIPKLSNQHFPERHMGLVPTHEHAWAKDSLAAIARAVRKHVDLDAVARVAGFDPGKKDDPLPYRADISPFASPALSGLFPPPTANAGRSRALRKTRIGVAVDSAFQFYYPENIEALREAGAETVWVSPLQDRSLGDIDGLYLGGGFPETHAKRLSDNVSFRDSVKKRAEEGLPIYAECGGLMYLGREIEMSGRFYPMADVLPAVYGFSKKPRGHGYAVFQVERENPYFKVGDRIRGHEFHYSFVLKWEGDADLLAFSMERGVGFYEGKDGVAFKNVLATYVHIHALGTPEWARAFVEKAREFQKGS
ncbi:Cobyrinate a,c-diamide synthase [Candidatus Desulfarcum epimagneticum]|uniref:Cobyrinate a,c-diamide synthase n=1 Tax=uncultured Desulfobacteraceae bacterium TaxID=218296 RepID=A0A484HIP9_9BACT|nr:Cobyrinate a,c-diamide synthase [uncultured Desulfobacteraceae bacterium]